MLVQLNAKIEAIRERADGLAVCSADGGELMADMVFIGIGIEAETGLAVDAGLTVENGIRVDDQCRTDDPAIFAIGESANHSNRFASGRTRLESVQNAVDQAKVAAAVIAGKDAHYDTVPWFWSDQYDSRLQMAGISKGYDRVQVRGEMTSDRFSLLYYQGQRLIAVDSISAAGDHMAARRLLGAGISPDPALACDPDVPLKSFL